MKEDDIIKAIVVYYSYGNHTRIIANKIKEKLNCDILEIKPKLAYSSDYQTVVEKPKIIYKQEKLLR